MKGYIVRLKGMGQEAHWLLETVSQGTKQETRGWSVYSNKADAEVMMEWAERENKKGSLEIVEVELTGL